MIVRELVKMHSKEIRPFVGGYGSRTIGDVLVVFRFRRFPVRILLVIWRPGKTFTPIHKFN